jgi:hypothetical protein
MSKFRLVSARLLGCVALLLPGLTGAQASQDAPLTPPPAVVRVYRPQYLGLEEALAMARAECSSSPVCIGSLGNGYFEIRTDPGAHERIAALMRKEDAPPRTQRIEAILLTANDQQPADLSRLPDGGKAVLQDLRGLLAFQNFQVVGMAAVLSSGGQVELEVAKRFRVLMFVEKDRSSERAIYVKKLRVLADEKPNPVIDTAVTIQLGETVVVGASSLDDGKQALVVLLSVLPVSGGKTAPN